MRQFFSIVALLASCLPALAQNGQPIKQSGNVTPSHAWCVTTNGIAQDCGTAAIPFLTSIGTVGQGQTICAWTALSTAPGSQKLCLGVFDSSAATITLQNFGIDTPQALNFVINGVTYPFPFTVGGIVGPGSSTSGDLACWNNTTGSLLKDCGTLGTGIVYGPNSSVANDVPVFSDTTGLLLKDSGYTFRRFFIAQPNFFTNNSTGSDSNNCLAAVSSGGNAPCATINHTVAVANTYDAGGFLPKINVATGTGTYAEQISLIGTPVGSVGMNIVGTGSANITIQAPTGLYAANVQDYAGIQFTGFTFSCASGAAGEWNAAKFAQIDVTSDVKFTACPGGVAMNGTSKSNFNWVGAPDFSGNMGAAVVLDDYSTLNAGAGCTVSSAPTYTTFMQIVASSVEFAAASCTGAFTGTKFQLVGNSWVAANGRSPNSVITGGTNGTITLGAQDDAGDPLTTPIPVASGGTGAATLTGALKGNGTSAFTQAACADLSNGGTACSQGYTATTWTPAVTTTSTVGTPAYTTQVGSYEQIGRQVIARFTIVLSGWTGSPTGNVEISGLPVAAANVANDNGMCVMSNYTVTGLAASNIGITGLIVPNTSVIILYQNSNTASSLITAAQVGTTATLIGSCNYHT